MHVCPRSTRKSRNTSGSSPLSLAFEHIDSSKTRCEAIQSLNVQLNCEFKCRRLRTAREGSSAARAHRIVRFARALSLCEQYEYMHMYMSNSPSINEILKIRLYKVVYFSSILLSNSLDEVDSFIQCTVRVDEEEYRVWRSRASWSMRMASRVRADAPDS